MITVDLRGHGDSDKPVGGEAYAPELLGADLVAVLDSAGVVQVDVIGYSMGNRVISALATLAPERIRRVVIGGAGPNELFASWDLDEVRAVLLRDEWAGHPLIEQVLRPALDAGADRDVLLAVIEGVAGSPLAIPGDIPTLFVAGENDPVPAGVQQLALELGRRLRLDPRSRPRLDAHGARLQDRRPRIPRLTGAPARGVRACVRLRMRVCLLVSGILPTRRTIASRSRCVTKIPETSRHPSGPLVLHRAVVGGMTHRMTVVPSAPTPLQRHLSHGGRN